MAGRSVEEPILVVCEGPSDCGLIDRLIDANRIIGVQSRYPKSLDAGDGFDAIPKLLTLLKDAGQLSNLDCLVLLVDANGEPQSRFDKSKDMLAAIGFTVFAPFDFYVGAPTAAVWFIRGQGKTGCFEHLLLDAVANSDPTLIAAVDAFAAAVGKPTSWSANKQAKMRVHALIAACCKEDPASSLAWVWNKQGNPFPLNNGVFDGLVNLLQRLTQIAACCSIARAVA